MKKCIICQGKQNKIFYYQKHTYYRCINCQHVTTYPLPSKQEINKHYQKKFKTGNYELLNNYSGKYLKVYDSFAKLLKSTFSNKSNWLNKKRVLDVGCFTGDFLLSLKKEGADVYGIELQKEAVVIANKSLPNRVVQADLMSKKIALGMFDAVTLTGVIEHVTDPVKLIKNVAKITNKKGVIFIQTPNSSSFLAKLMGKYWPPYSPIEHIHLFSKKSLITLLKANNYEIVLFKNHWKQLPVSYVYKNLENFGPEFHRILKPIALLINKLNFYFPFYIGEMIIIARKTN